jgi:hypothetical protein
MLGFLLNAFRDRIGQAGVEAEKSAFQTHVGEQVNQQAGIFGLEGPDSDLQAVFCVEGVDYVVQSSYSWENLQRISRMRRIICLSGPKFSSFVQ